MSRAPPSDCSQKVDPPRFPVRAVADEAGTTTRAVYSLFGSKDGLLTDALAQSAFEFLFTEIDALPVTDDPVSDLLDVGRVSAARHRASSLVPHRVQRVVRVSIRGLSSLRHAGAVGTLRARVEHVADAQVYSRQVRERRPASSSTPCSRASQMPNCGTVFRNLPTRARGRGMAARALHRRGRLAALNSGSPS